MGVKDLRKAFNDIAEPSYSCTLALMDTHRAHGVEGVILTFVGTKADGEQFTITSRPVMRTDEVNSVAAETAQKLLDQ
jgi:hypothetical protein